MKQKDLVTIIVIGFVAGIFSLLITQAVFVPKKDKQISVEIVDPIKAEFQKPDQKVFNKNAVNPTQLIQIGNNTNQTPF